jgi:hypothetical protein
LNIRIPINKTMNPKSYEKVKTSMRTLLTVKIMKYIQTSKFLSCSIVQRAAADPYAVTEVPDVL